jgi:solute carrier family 25 protein 33/36
MTRLKRLTASTDGSGGPQEWAGMLSTTRTAKCVASLITYPMRPNRSASGRNNWNGESFGEEYMATV